MTFAAPSTFYDSEMNKLWEPYNIKYNHNGSIFSCHIYATSFSHAEQMLNDLKQSGEITERVVMEEV